MSLLEAPILIPVPGFPLFLKEIRQQLCIFKFMEIISQSHIMQCMTSENYSFFHKFSFLIAKIMKFPCAVCWVD
jgi:hypothetical protein